VTKDLAYSFQGEKGQKITLNKRLPGITQRDVLRHNVSVRYADRAAKRWVVRGSRLFLVPFRPDMG
jgi:hypothetical protein